MAVIKLLHLLFATAVILVGHIDTSGHSGTDKKLTRCFRNMMNADQRDETDLKY